MRKIGILTGGGDCPGLNAVIRGVVEKCAESVIGTAQIIVYGFRNADNVHAEFAQRIRNAESVVPADGDKTFKPECIKHVDDC